MSKKKKRKKRKRTRHFLVIVLFFSSNIKDRNCMLDKRSLFKNTNQVIPDFYHYKNRMNSWYSRILNK